MNKSLISLESLHQLDSMLEKEFEENISSYDPIDVERVRSDKWQCERFLMKNKNTKEAFKLLTNTLKWKKMKKVHQKKDEDFAREFYEVCCNEVLDRNEDDLLVVWQTSKYTNQFSEIRELAKDFVIHEIEYFDNLAGRQGIILISDCKHFGLFTIDIEMSRFMSELLNDHYPFLLRKSVVFNLSIMLYPVAKIILNFVNEELRKNVIITDVEKLPKLINPKYIPVGYPEGQREERCNRLPSNCVTYKSIYTHFSTEQIKRFDALLEKIKNS